MHKLYHSSINGVKEMAGFRTTFNISYTQSDHINGTVQCGSVDDVETSALLVQKIYTKHSGQLSKKRHLKLSRTTSTHVVIRKGIRPHKLNSLFIISKFLDFHEAGMSFFIIHYKFSLENHKCTDASFDRKKENHK